MVVVVQFVFHSILLKIKLENNIHILITSFQILHGSVKMAIQQKYCREPLTTYVPNSKSSLIYAG